MVETEKIDFKKYYKLLGDEKITYKGGALPEQVYYAFDNWSMFENCHTILDLGSGNGDWSMWLRGKGYKITECDLNLESDSYNKYNYDIHNLGFKDKTFDGIFCNGVFEHALSPFIMLCESNRVLKIDGEMFLNVPRSDNKLMSVLPQHINVVDIHSALNIFDKSGFKIIEGISFLDPINGHHLVFKLKKIKDLK